LSEALQQVESGHPGLKEARRLADAIAWDGSQAGRLPNPELVFITEGAAAQPSAQRQADYFGGIAQTLPLGARLTRARQLAARERDVALREAELRLWELQTELRREYANVWYFQEAQKLQDQHVAAATRTVELMEQRFNQGDISGLELAQAKLVFQSTLSIARDLQVERGQSRRALNQALGQALSEPYEVVLPQPSATTWDLAHVEVLVETHPVLEAARAGVGTAHAQQQLVRANQYPDVQVEALYRREAVARADSLDVGIRLPLPLWQNQRGKLRAAAARVEAAEAHVEQVRNDVEQALFGARERHSRWLDEWERATSVNRPEARAMTDQLESRLAAGDIRLTEFLLLRRDIIQLELRELVIRRELEWAVAELEPMAMQHK
jgi:cobalt-zinc-cadmium efflux system outer membrane protein